MSNVTAAYTCRFCRMPSEGSTTTCPHCGAAVDVRTRVSDSGWVEQPPVKDMARIQFGHSRCQIEGTTVPTADFALAGDDWVYFSHHVLLWVDPQVQMQAMPIAAGWNRVYAGMPLVMMSATGPGHLALSHDSAGDLLAIPLQHGQGIDVREHRFLAATGNVSYEWFDPYIWYQTGSGDDVETEYPLGMFMDRFTANSGPGLLLLHAPGNCFLRDLRSGESICVQPSAVVYKDPSISMQLHFEFPAGQSYARSYNNGTAWLMLHGPGRVAIQSVFEHAHAPYNITNYSVATMQRW
jgi:uncharacterized protein (AIM24 family)